MEKLSSWGVLETLIDEYGASPRKVLEIILFDHFEESQAREALKTVCEEYDCEELLN